MSLSGAVCFGTFSRPALLWILLLSLLFTITIAANETQLCYYDVGKLAGPEIIPCFEGGSVSPCCKIGSTCLYDNSCYDATTGVTYQYGCTDSTYKDSNCPQKCDLDTGKDIID
ncbi:hypothetical protein K432DRAFT_301106 [Lepidopterella palustris CBS 459.81]|uniref:Uncharacterized protein n=1 Tax=Lepidopterella palustris CBS 459.81 TaxID=1314670 RepID=A0A8E2E7K7_9PEZI|nr:hypothetical protein K432DRAFT_301106 [Lepidopterella palustris CBS 459.81]